MKGKIKYEFSEKLWQYPGPNGWYFISIPTDISSEIREALKWQEEGWGRMKIIAIICSTQWETAIWYDRKIKSYLLPIKSEIRKKENLKLQDEIKIAILV